MPRTIINPSEVIASGGLTDTARQRVSSAKNGIRDVNDRLDPKIKQRNNIGGRLSALTNNLGSIEGKIARIRSVVDGAAGNYQRADDRVSVLARDLNSSASIRTTSGTGIANVWNLISDWVHFLGHRIPPLWWITLSFSFHAMLGPVILGASTIIPIWRAIVGSGNTGAVPVINHPNDNKISVPQKASVVADGVARDADSDNAPAAVQTEKAELIGKLEEFKTYALNEKEWNDYTNEGKKGIDVDKGYGAQCADISKEWVKRLFALQEPPGLSAWKDGVPDVWFNWEGLGLKDVSGGPYEAGDVGFTIKPGTGHTFVIMSSPDADGKIEILQQNPDSPHIAKIPVSEITHGYRK